MQIITQLGTFDVKEKQRESFRSGVLWQDWYSKYPNIFDDDDLRIVKSQASAGHHFYEWLAAILLYHTMGYLSLVEKYQFRNHKSKQSTLKQLNSPALFEAIAYRDNDGAVQCPDLLVYAPDFSDWFFCEVKGEDQITDEQERRFEALVKITQKPIQLIQFRLK